jgi:hypothetical protein
MNVAITGSCGHTAERNLTNSSGSSDIGAKTLKKSIAYWSAKECADCWKASKQVETANALDQFGSLPALAGSERQVAWATQIREKQLVKVSEELVKMQASHDHLVSALTELELAADTVMPDYRAKAQLLTTVTDAKFWIDTRDEDSQVLLGIDRGYDHLVKFNLETQKVILSQRGQQKRIEYKTKRDYYDNTWGVRVPQGSIRTMMVGGNKFYDREVA